MANFGLLGALSGLGQGMTQAGESIIARRERALAEAKALAAEQRKRAQQLEDKASDRDFELKTLGVKGEQAAARTELAVKGRLEAIDRTAGHAAARQEDSQAFTAEQKAADRAAQRELVKVRAQAERENIRFSKTLQDQLDDDNTQGITYGKQDPKRPDYKRLLIIKKDGSVVDGGAWAYKPARADDEEEQNKPLVPTARR